MTPQLHAEMVPAVRPILACRLRHKPPQEGRRCPPPGAGEIELENTTSGVVEIKVDIHPLQYLDLQVSDAAGNVISKHHYGNLFSLLAEPYTMRLRPGEKYTGLVSLLGNVPRENQCTGSYRVQAIYEFDNVRAVSEPLAVTVNPARVPE